ncbi:MAG: sulfatase-like hydrolase/transferase [Verrucomicrobiae bacterium]|nr:sulfatase-like hydrolase/transferase [Verrucomicrobiae bacterium]
MKTFLAATLAVLLFPLCGFAADKPHIVLVMADDQGWGDMAYQGDPVLKTPNFDDAAATGLRFDRFYAAAPVCSPTRASVMTGRHPNRMGVFKWGYPMRPQETTIAEALKSAGYTTGHFGKWHLGSVRHDSPVNPGKNGFDHWVSAPNFYDNDAVMSDEGKAVQKQGESSFIAVDDCLAWMKEALKGEAPIFAVVWFGSPHSPHQAVEEDRSLYADQPKNKQDFLGEITGMDRAFGKLRDSLSELGIRDNTVLWYCSDNGGLPKVGNVGGFRGHKGDVYEGGLLVPAILEWPEKVKMPRSTDVRCNTCDIFPTLLDIIGAKTPSPAPLDGISLLPLIENQAPSARSRPMGFWDYAIKGIRTPSAEWMGELLSAQQAGKDLPPDETSRDAAKLPDPSYPLDSFPGHSAWIDGDWKLHRIQNQKTGEVKWELYDLGADPKEEKDLASDEADRVASMRDDLESWLTSVVKSLNGEDY